MSRVVDVGLCVCDVLVYVCWYDCVVVYSCARVSISVFSCVLLSVVSYVCVRYVCVPVPVGVFVFGGRTAIQNGNGNVSFSRVLSALCGRYTHTIHK